MDEAALNQLATRILDAAFVVHRQLGPGLLETAYKPCLLYELRHTGMRVEVEVPVPVIYRGEKLAEIGYRIDLLVEGEIVIEIKALETIAPVHQAQLLSYLKLSDRRIGYLINFNVPMLKDVSGDVFIDCKAERGERNDLILGRVNRCLHSGTTKKNSRSMSS